MKAYSGTPQLAAAHSPEHPQYASKQELARRWRGQGWGQRRLRTRRHAWQDLQAPRRWAQQAPQAARAQAAAALRGGAWGRLPPHGCCFDHPGGAHPWHIPSLLHGDCMVNGSPAAVSAICRVLGTVPSPICRSLQDLAGTTCASCPVPCVHDSSQPGATGELGVLCRLRRTS